MYRGIEFGARSRFGVKPVAKIVPINGAKPKKKRKLGVWEGKVKFVFGDNFKMTDEELLDLR